MAGSGETKATGRDRDTLSGLHKVWGTPSHKYVTSHIVADGGNFPLVVRSLAPKSMKHALVSMLKKPLNTHVKRCFTTYEKQLPHLLRKQLQRQTGFLHVSQRVLEGPLVPENRNKHRKDLRGGRVRLGRKGTRANNTNSRCSFRRTLHGQSILVISAVKRIIASCGHAAHVIRRHGGVLGISVQADTHYWANSRSFNLSCICDIVFTEFLHILAYLRIHAE